MNNFHPSEKLKSYFEEISQKTDRTINIKPCNDLGLSGMTCAFEEHPTEILILYDPIKYNSQQDLEQSLAHEATHGLLFYGENYSKFKPETDLNETEAQIVIILGTMIDDIVVNKIIHEKGFELYAPAYLDMVKKETSSARKGKDIYKEYSYDISVKEKFMVFRYILAWSFIEYFDLNKNARRFIEKFLQSFEKAYPGQFILAEKVKRLLKSNDVFTPKGHFAVMNECLILWEMNKKIGMEFIRS